MNLNKIDFSDGIRPEEIQDNFEILQQQLNRERLGVGGFGIASGFDVTPIVTKDKFAVSLSNASIIDETGEELFIPECEVDIDPPELFTSLEYHTIDYNNRIVLNQIPYAVDRRTPAEYLVSKDPKVSGIYINYPANNYNVDDYIRVSDINGSIITVAGAVSKEVAVRYSYTADRIDTLYLKQDNTVGVIKGTTSTTPSKPYMPNDGKMLIAYLMIESKYVDEDNDMPHAYLYVRDDMRSLRNLFTDSENNLYICGTPFDDLQIIHMKEPKDPKENTLWLNTQENTLYYWKSTDGFVYTNKITIDTDFIENNNANRDFATYMNFLLEGDELEVYHNGAKLSKGIHYYELYNSLPTYYQNIPDKTEGNSFRIIEDNTSNNGLTLSVGDEIMYMIRYKDSHFMWVPVNKATYVNAKNHRVFCTNDYMPNNRDGYFESKRADALGQFSIGVDKYYDYKYQYFLFDREKDLEMLFTPGRQELSIIINQMVLHSDQFEEITVYDLIDGKLPTSVANAAASHFGWTNKAISEYKDDDNDYDNAGIGFKLVEPLDCGYNANSQSYEAFDGSADLYVEAFVERRICCSPAKRKFQRSATFVAEDIIIADDEIVNTGIVNLLDDDYYRYNENQLEVFVNGIKLISPSNFSIEPELIEEFGYYIQSNIEGRPDKIGEPITAEAKEEYKEYADQRYFEKQRASVCRKFKINKTLNVGDTITYRISTNIYSYDHINNLLDDLEAKIDCNLDTVLAAYEGIGKVKEDIDIKINEVETQLAKVSDTVNKLDANSFDPFSVLGIANMPPALLNVVLSSLTHINTSFEYKGNSEHVFDVTKAKEDIRMQDYLTVVRRTTKGDYFLIPDEDYTIISGEDNNKNPYSYFKVLNSSGWETGNKIIITGIKLGYGR